MTYDNSFMEEYWRLKKQGVPKDQIEYYYKAVAVEGINSDKRYARHNLPLYGKSEDEGEGSGVEEFGFFCYQSGTQRPQPEEAPDPMKWCSIRLSVVPIYAEDAEDIYLESVSILEQLDDKDIIELISSLSERRQQIVELLVAGWSQTRIAAHLGISSAAVSKHVAHIAKTLEPYFRKKHWIKLT